MNYQTQNNHLQNQYRNFSSYQSSQNTAYHFDIIEDVVEIRRLLYSPHNHSILLEQ